jgi:ParB-like chromosome segregation protein Spo0J
VRSHPYAEIFPLLDDAALSELAADIKQHGLREPIRTFGGLILDGRNRFLACQKANIAPRFEPYVGSDQQALAWVVSANVHRRHLSASQLAMAAARISSLKTGANQHSEGVPIGTSSKMVGATERSTKRARKVIEQGSKRLQQAVDSGEIAVSRAAAVVSLPKAEQLAAARAPDPEPEEGAEPEPDENARIELMLKERDAAVEQILGERGAKELDRMAAEIASLKSSRDEWMNGKAAITNLLKAEQRKSERLLKRVKELESENEALQERIAIMGRAA